MKLWGAQTVSLLGSQIGGMAFQFTAILTLAATPVQLGYLEAARALPGVVLGLLAGVWVDRMRRRRVLIWADLGRALLLLSVPAAALGGWLGMGQLYLIAALVSILTLFFDVAYPAYLPSLLHPDQLVEGNSKLSMSESVAEVLGPGAGGLLVQLLTPPLALAVDCLSFLVSALSLGLIRHREAPGADRAGSPDLRREMVEGIGFVVQEPVLRALLGSSVLVSLSGGFFAALYAVYVVQELGLTPVWMGLIVGVGGISALLGAMGAAPITRRLGIGPTLIGCRLVAAAFNLLLVAAAGPTPLILAMLILSQAADAVWTVYGINEVSLQQRITPDRLLGRVHAGGRVASGLALPLGAVTGGYLGQTLGLRGSLGLAVAIGGLSALWLFFSPVRTLHGLPADATPGRLKSLPKV